MTPMAFNLGPTELIIILVIVLVLFGGARLAGLGKSTGRAIKEFKEETSSLTGDKKKDDDVVDAEVVDQPTQQAPQTPPAVEAPQQQAPAAPQQSNATQPTPGSATQPYDSRRDA